MREMLEKEKCMVVLGNANFTYDQIDQLFKIWIIKFYLINMPGSTLLTHKE